MPIASGGCSTPATSMGLRMPSKVFREALDISNFLEKTEMTFKDLKRSLEGQGSLP